MPGVPYFPATSGLNVCSLSLPLHGPMTVPMMNKHPLVSLKPLVGTMKGGEVDGVALHRSTSEAQSLMGSLLGPVMVDFMG